MENRKREKEFEVIRNENGKGFNGEPMLLVHYLY